MGECAGVQAFALRGSGHLDLAGRAGSGGGTDGDDAPGGAGIYVICFSQIRSGFRVVVAGRSDGFVCLVERRTWRCRRIWDAQRCYYLLFPW
jgi:hypothetical protein